MCLVIITIIFKTINILFTIIITIKIAIISTIINVVIITIENIITTTTVIGKIIVTA